MYMQSVYKIILPAVFAVSAVSCENLTELNLQDSPNEVTPDQAGAEFLYNAIQLKFAEIYMGEGNNIGTLATSPNLFWFASDLTRMTTMDGGSTYQNAFQPTYFDALWTDVYADMFPDIEALAAISTERGRTKEIGTAHIMQAYTMMMLVDIFGDVPFSERGQGIAVVSPKADAGADVYAAAIALLDQAIVELNTPNTPVLAPGIDNFYGGNVARWITLANTLKLRAAVTTRLANPNAGAQVTTAITAGVVDEQAEDWQWNYGSNRVNPSTRHPLYIDAYESLDADYLGNYFMWVVAEEKTIRDSIVDPRARYYFYRQQTNLTDEIENDQNAFDCIISAVPTRDRVPDHYLAVDPNMPYCLGTARREIGENGYFGRDHGNNSGVPPDGNLRTVWGIYPMGGLYDNNSGQLVQKVGTTGALGRGIIPLMTRSYVHFLRAEAALTMNTGESAATQLEAAIRASFAKVSGFAGAPAITAAEIDPYVAYVLGRFNAANDASKLAILGKEFYIALWGQPFEHYNLYRRTCAPTNMQPLLENPQDGVNFTQSAFYPAVYVARNQNATQKENTRVSVFWDTNGSGCNY